jgi:hypothetical protein
MTCSPRAARIELDRLISLANSSQDGRHTIRVGGLPLTIHAAPEAQPIFYRCASRIISKRNALQLLEVYHG